LDSQKFPVQNARCRVFIPLGYLC